jgi:choline dehydrogenase-like flavoprotein
MNTISKHTVFDAIVIGSGANGGWAAKELTEGGMRVLMLEAGSDPSQKNLVQSLYQKIKAQYRNLYKNSSASPQAPLSQPIQAKCYAWKTNPDFFVNDIQNPYTTPADKPFYWFRGRQVGGRMVIKDHGRRLFRFSDYEFKAASRDGYGEEWPISHADLAPYYEKVERFIKIRGFSDRIPNLPDSVFSPMTPTTTEQLLKSAF